MMTIEYDDAGNYRLVNNVTKKKGKWATYKEISRLKDGKHDFIGFSEYFSEGLCNKVFRVHLVGSVILDVVGIKPR